MHILLVAATPFEISPCLQWLSTGFQQPKEGIYKNNELQVQVLITGVGSTATAFQLGLMLGQNRPNWVLNAGIAGAFDPQLGIGTVVQVLRERFGDLGVEEADGRFTDLQEMGFVPLGILSNPNPPLPNLPLAQGLTVNKVHGSADSIHQILEKYPDVQVESMEGAAVFYACLAAGVPFAEIRSISNRVEPRNRDAWDLPLSIKNLNEVLVGMLKQLTGMDA